MIVLVAAEQYYTDYRVVQAIAHVVQNLVTAEKQNPKQLLFGSIDDEGKLNYLRASFEVRNFEEARSKSQRYHVALAVLLMRNGYEFSEAYKDANIINVIQSKVAKSRLLDQTCRLLHIVQPDSDGATAAGTKQSATKR